MRIKDELYFAPNIKFSDLDLQGNDLPEQFKQRIYGYYLDPAGEAADKKYGFASGILLVTCIDALARIMIGNGVAKRFIQWCHNELPSFNNTQICGDFYENFRNGLVHEARIKNGCEFTLSSDRTVTKRGIILSINPYYLAKEVEAALNRYVEYLKIDVSGRNRLSNRIQSEFNFELNS